MLGEYLLPSVRAYQYCALQELRKRSDIADVRHNIALVSELDTFGLERAARPGVEWLGRDRIEQWRELGLHRVLRRFLASEAASAELSNERDASPSFADSLTSLRDRLPVALAEAVLDRRLLWDVGLAFNASAAGFVAGGPIGGLIGFVGGVVVGRVGQRGITVGLRRLRWDRLVDHVSDILGQHGGRAVQKFALGFGDVTVFGRRGQ
jgi:hypothetical protein